MATSKWAASVAVLAAWAIASAAGPAPAQDLPETPLWTNGARVGWLQFGVSSGRVTLARWRATSTSTNSGGGARKERLSIRMSGGDPVIDYELTTPDQDVSVEVAGRSRLQLRRTPKADARFPAVEFDQPAQGPIVLRVGAKDQERVCRAPSVWHLAVVEPGLAKEHLFPLLKVLNRDWDLGKTSSEVEAALVRSAGERGLPDKQQWALWVAQLGDPRFAKREAADRQLREAGRIVVTYLQQLDSSKLDAEQQYRVRRILAALSDTESSETPEQIAVWLSGDPAVWLALLSREEEPTRRAAAKQIEALLGGPAGVDPAADPATRKAQIERLRARLLGP